MTAERSLKSAAQLPAVEPIEVALIEDDSGTRASLREIIESAADCRCVGEFRSVAEAITGIPAVAPKVVLVDVNLPDGTGVDCVRRLAPTMPSTEFVYIICRTQTGRVITIVDNRDTIDVEIDFAATGGNGGNNDGMTSAIKALLGGSGGK
jgi:chemotaxis response regulator CheB